MKQAIFYTSKIDISAIKEYNSEIQKGTSYQEAMALASKNTNKETIALMESAKGATVTNEELTAAQKASTLAAKAQSVAFKAVSMAGNMLVMALVTKGIELAASAIDHLVNRSKYAAEAMEEAQQEITDSQNKLNEVSDTVSENKDRFLELAQGVDQFSNNVSLSKDDYQEYLDISNKLADIAPDLITGYDEQLVSKSINATGYNRFGMNNGYSNNWELVNTQAILMSEIEVYGSIVWSSSGYDTGNTNQQFELIANSKSAINNRSAWYWLKDIASSSYWCGCSDDGYSYLNVSSDTYYYVCPRFVLA